MFWELLSRTGNLLVNRALSPFLLKIGCSSDLALLIGLIVKALLAAGQATLFMSSSGENEGVENSTSSSQQPSNDSSSAPSSSSVGASSGTSSSVDQAPGSREKSALDQRKDELLIEKLKERKGDVGDGQRISDVRKTVETEFNVKDKGGEFELIKLMEKETTASKKEDCPVTNSAFNEVKEYESKIQDGRGGRGEVSNE